MNYEPIEPRETGALRTSADLRELVQAIDPDGSRARAIVQDEILRALAIQDAQRFAQEYLNTCGVPTEMLANPRDANRQVVDQQHRLFRRHELGVDE